MMLTNTGHFNPDTTCEQCGRELPPRDVRGYTKCLKCHLPSFQNPLPVIVGLIPVRVWYGKDKSEISIMGIRRGMNPEKGRVTLPGGFLELEHWRQALVGEIKDETGQILDGVEFIPFHFNSGGRKYNDDHGVYQHNRLLCFAYLNRVIDEKDLPPFVAEPDPRTGQIEATERVFFVHRRDDLHLIVTHESGEHIPWSTHYEAVWVFFNRILLSQSGAFSQMDIPLFVP